MQGARIVDLEVDKTESEKAIAAAECRRETAGKKRKIKRPHGRLGLSEEDTGGRSGNQASAS